MSSSTNSNLTDSRRSVFLLVAVIVTAAIATLVTPVVANESPAGATAADSHSGIVVGASGSSINSAAVVDHRYNGGYENQNDVDDDMLDVEDRRYAALLGQKNDEDETEEDVEKRRSKTAYFRSDLGKRDLKTDVDDEFDAEKRTYRARGGKAFKADLGKRVRGGSMFRSDLGRRSDPSMASNVRHPATGSSRSLDGLALSESSSSVELPIGEALSEVDGGNHEVDRRRSMFRSDLGKRSTRAESVRRMFRADLGKRRVAFRHDLG